MKPIWKNSIASVCALLVVAYLSFGVYMGQCQSAPSKCGKMNVIIKDASKRQYVSADGIRQLVSSRGISPIGKSPSKVSLRSIEDCVRHHPMVRTAECYKTIQGDVCIILTQRVPLVRILAGSDTYFVDTDRKVMPVSESVKTPVLIVSGTIGKRMATHEICDFAEWLQKDAFWRSRIASVEVSNPQMVLLMQTNQAATIRMGGWNRFEQKLGKLKHWYDAEQSLNPNQYTMVDLRYHGQVIGIKN